MRIGCVLPQYDFSVPGESPLQYETIEHHARMAEQWGYDSLWLSDHVRLDLAKYGGPDVPFGAFEPVATLAALARTVPRVRLGTLVLLEALRPAAILAKSLATLDRITGGRLDIGLGAGWYAPDYEAVGLELPGVRERFDRLRDALEVVGGLIGGAAHTFDGKYHQSHHAVVDPPALQVPRPPLFVGGKGDLVLRVAVDLADGWNTSWIWTPEAYRGRLDVLHRLCDEAGRDPDTVWRSVGLYALCGESEADLRHRFARLGQLGPPGVLDGVTLDEWRRGRLVGTVAQIREQLEEWNGLGVETVIVNPGSVPYHVGTLDDIEALAEACGPATRG